MTPLVLQLPAALLKVGFLLAVAVWGMMEASVILGEWLSERRRRTALPSYAGEDDFYFPPAASIPSPAVPADPPAVRS